MTDRERADLKTLYEGWPLERLAHAFANESADYQPGALVIMREVLSRRGASADYLAQVKAAAPKPAPENKVARAFREKKGEIFGRRFAAFVIDTVLSFCILLLADLALGAELYQRTIALWLLLFAGYYIFTEGRYGATPGKKLMALRVVNQQLGPCGYGRALVRFLLRIVECYTVPLMGLIGFWNSKTGRRVGDALAGTLVVRAEDLG